MKCALLSATGWILCAAPLVSQARVTVADIGPGAGGRILQEVLARPHRLVEPDTSWFIQRRGEAELRSVVVLGRTAAVSGVIEGDVVVVDGDLFVRPGARISGRAIAIGGGVYASSLAIVGKGTLSFRDNTYEISRSPDGYRLVYRSLREYPSPPLLFPGVYGLRMPLYDRVNGASMPFGPAFGFAGGRAQVNVLATYRSDLGKVDPAITGSIQLSRRSRATIAAQRGTLSNDAWIWSNFVNSFSVLTAGIDTRNYYRADRAEVGLHRRWEFTRTVIEPFVGGLAERAWSVGPSVGERRGPWSILGRADMLDGMWRPNPTIAPGHITSVLAGGTVLWESQELKLRGRARGETSLSAPNDRRFVQITSDLDVTFPTLGEQEYALDVHWVTTTGDVPPVPPVPPQRFSYIGGSGTLPFLDLLEQGGDELLLIDQRYAIPVQRVRVGILGNPTLLLRHRLGSAGLGKLPSFEQLVGIGVMLALLRTEVQLDPASGDTRLSFGFAFAR